MSLRNLGRDAERFGPPRQVEGAFDLRQVGEALSLDLGLAQLFIIRARTEIDHLNTRKVVGK